jgi:hypothetical protein
LRKKNYVIVLLPNTVSSVFFLVSYVVSFSQGYL